MAGCDGWDSVNPLCQADHVLGNAATAAGSDAFTSIADYFARLATSAVSWLWSQLDDAASIDLGSAGIERDLLATGAIAAIITFGLFLIQVIGSTLRQDGRGLGRGVRGLAVSFVGAAFAVACTQILLAAVDGLCNGVVHFALGTTVSGLGSRLILATALTSIANPAGLLLMSLVLIAAVVVVWVALMIRKLLIIVSAVFAPIAFAGAASDVSRSWVRRWIEFTLALVFSKLILVIVFLIGLSVLNGAGQPTTGTPTTGGAAGATSATSAAGAITTLVIGSLTLLLAGFAPWIAIKMVHFAGDAFHTVHAQAAGASAGARSAVAMPQKVLALSTPLGAAGRAAAVAGAGRGGAAGQSGAQPKSGPPGTGAGGLSGVGAATASSFTGSASSSSAASTSAPAGGGGSGGLAAPSVSRPPGGAPSDGGRS